MAAKRIRLLTRAIRVGISTAKYAGLGTLRPPDARSDLRQKWAQAILQNVGASVQANASAQSVANIARQSGPTLVLANHRSALDIPVLLSMFGGVFLSRHDLKNWPLIGPAARVGGTIFVERGNVESARQAVHTMQECLQSGATLIMFPEGGTFDGDEVRPMRRGAFRAVAGLKLPSDQKLRIIPVGLAYDRGAEFVEESFAEHALKIGERRNQRISVSVGESMVVDGTSLVSMEDMRTRIQKLVHLAREAHSLAPRNHGQRPQQNSSE